MNMSMIMIGLHGEQSLPGYAL